MLIDMDVTVAYKCISCGTFDFFNINLFRLFPQNRVISKCRCEGSQIELFQSAKNQYAVSVPCIGCGLKHLYTFEREEFLNNDIKIYTCPSTGIKQCFIGKDDVVGKYVDNFERELDIILDGFGYDRYFVNTRVMIDTINKIHDIAENDRLNCECGSKDIRVTLLKKGIYLKCSRCSASKLISAATNNDLKETLLKKSITLIGKESESVRLF